MRADNKALESAPLFRPFAFLLILIWLGAPACLSAADRTSAKSAARAGGYDLVVLLIVDQFRYDYLQRFGDSFRHGLRRLMTEGVSFADAHHAHALTETCPGHAALATGVHPSRSGIVENNWVDRATGADVYCVGDPEFQRSPRPILVDGIADWLRAQDPAARVFSISGKDRAAIVMGGHKPDGVYWYDRLTGGFATSAYYPPAPDWVASFNIRQGAARYFGQSWRASSMPRELAEKAQVVRLDRGVFPDDFPHPLGPGEVVPSPAFFDAFFGTPLQDAELNAFAGMLIEREGLGTDRHTDLLAISYSALDLVGHQYGPNSREVMDTLLRLDVLIGELLDRIETRVGKGRTLVLFSSDHGVQALPEYQRLHGVAATRAGAEDVACLQRARDYLKEHFDNRRLFSKGLRLDDAAVAKLNVSSDALDQVVRERIESCAAVARVWTRAELLDGEGSDLPYFAAYRNSLHPERGDDYFIQYRENHQPVRGTGTGHGTPYDYDTHVPLIFWGGGLRAHTVAAPAATVDAAPTLAALAGIRVPAGLDGRDRVDQVR